MNGSLIYEDYIKLYKKQNIISSNFKYDQAQPSSLDLTLSNECYEIDYSFLCPNSKVRDKLKKFSKKKYRY